jgi:acyl phosphate:glycerol-3-phosphate acyltransferase
VNPADILALVVCAAAGYAIGSLPASAWIARAAGVDVRRDEDLNPGSADVWKLAGHGWGLLAFTADLSKGVLPVALATVTWSWGAGWAAGLGALAGACWPAFGRIPGGRGVAVFAGAAFALAPPAGVIGVLLALAVAGVARLVGRSGRTVAIAVGAVTFPLLFYAAYRDPLRLAALMSLYLVAVLRYLTTRRE